MTVTESDLVPALQVVRVHLQKNLLRNQSEYQKDYWHQLVRQVCKPQVLFHSLTSEASKCIVSINRFGKLEPQNSHESIFTHQLLN